MLYADVTRFFSLRTLLMTHPKPGVKVSQQLHKVMITNAPISEILKHKGNQVWAVRPDMTVYDALVVMADKNVGALCVTEGDKLIGILSERDYTRKIVLHGRSSRNTRVREIISNLIFSVTPDSSIDECLHLMTDKRVRHLPVLDHGKLAGLISIGDLVNYIITAQQSTIEQLQTYISGVPG
ncbi:MAG: Hypoxic response protein 1 [Verrucomicrobiota bacterium]|jgi:CBS domain-containing protein